MVLFGDISEDQKLLLRKFLLRTELPANDKNLLTWEEVQKTIGPSNTTFNGFRVQVKKGGYLGWTLELLGKEGKIWQFNLFSGIGLNRQIVFEISTTSGPLSDSSPEKDKLIIGIVEAIQTAKETRIRELQEAEDLKRSQLQEKAVREFIQDEWEL